MDVSSSECVPWYLEPERDQGRDQSKALRAQVNLGLRCLLNASTHICVMCISDED